MIGGQPMIERVYRQAGQAARLDKVLVATDDSRILEAVRSFDGHAVMTSPDHATGTERCAEALAGETENWEVVINIQGDEPFVSPAQIDLLASAFENEKVTIATLVREAGPREIHDENAVKAVLNRNDEAMYFSRSAIPFPGGGTNGKHLIHIGMYGYRGRILPELAGLPPGRLETAECLEQLRWLEHGYRIHARLSKERSHSVDTPEDLERVKSTFGL